MLEHCDYFVNRLRADVRKGFPCRNSVTVKLEVDFDTLSNPTPVKIPTLPLKSYIFYRDWLFPWQAITDDGIHLICQGCSELVSVNFSDIPNLRDYSLRSLSQHCAKLQTLQVAHCSQLSDDGFVTLAQVSVGVMVVGFPLDASIMFLLGMVRTYGLHSGFGIGTSLIQVCVCKGTLPGSAL